MLTEHLEHPEYPPLLASWFSFVHRLIWTLWNNSYLFFNNTNSRNHWRNCQKHRFNQVIDKKESTHTIFLQSSSEPLMCFFNGNWYLSGVAAYTHTGARTIRRLYTDTHTNAAWLTRTLTRTSMISYRSRGLELVSSAPAGYVDPMHKAENWFSMHMWTWKDCIVICALVLWNKRSKSLLDACCHDNEYSRGSIQRIIQIWQAHIRDISIIPYKKWFRK